MAKEELMANGEGESNHVRFFELIFQEDLCIPQTWMEKQPQHRHTHRQPAGDLVQLDHVVAPIQWRNMITDVATVPGAALNSKHYLVKIRTTLRTKPGKADTSTAQAHQETDSRGKARVQHGSRGGNGSTRSHATPPCTRRHGRAAHTPHGGRRSPTSGGNTDTGAAGQAMANTPQSRQRRNRGAHTIEPNPPKQAWIIHNTWDLIQKRSQAREAANTEEETRLNKEVRKQARRDKTQWLKDRLAESEQTMDARVKWKWIKRIRSDYKQRPVSIHNAKGKPVSQSKQAATFAEHLANSQWAPPSRPYTGNRDPIAPQADVDADLFTMEELNAALRKAANNKAAGVDDLPTEVWQWMTEENRRYLLDILNEALTAGKIPQD